MLRHRERAWRARNGRQYAISWGGSPPWLVCPETVRSVDTSADAAREVVSPSTEYVTQSDHRKIELAWTADLMRDPYICLICAPAVYTE